MEAPVKHFVMTAGLAVSLTVAGINLAYAEAKWQKPVAQDCSLKGGEKCNVEFKCPAETPFVVSGGGGMPQVDRKDHQVTMTMNLPVDSNTWRVRYRKLSSGPDTNFKMVVRVRCSGSAKEAGWE